MNYRMAIDWKAEVEKRRDDILEDLKTMLRIESVRDESIATADAPLGPGPKEALDAFLNIGKRDGFEVEEFDGMAGHIKFGDGKEDLGILAHVDVMPAGKGWDTDPFNPVIKDGKLYARGASDDKGPSMAAYYGLKIVKELGTKVGEKAFILVDGKPIKREKKAYYLFYKPRGVVTTMTDPQGRRTVADFAKDLPERVFPVGRLDYNLSLIHI